jgi:hypothetical protein
MALTGKFLADFSSFQDAVTKAEISLRSFETGAGKVGTALNKMTDSFSGRKIITEAELAVRAVNEIGGASKLTEREQARLNATVTEAIAKYNALGYAAPKDMLALADATRRVEQETSKLPGSLSSLSGTLKSLAGAFGVAFSIGAVVQFGKSVFDSASQIHDLAEQLGISSEAVQGFKFAAEQSGSSLEAVGRAITKLNEHLSEGDKSTVKALRDAGLNFRDIASMKPEDAFLAIADAIQKIPDPMKQSELALQLFGKSGAELLPAIKEGFRGISDGADKMSDETIKSLEAAQDAWGKLADKVTSQVTSSWKNFFMFVENSMRHGIGVGVTMADLTAAATAPDVNLPSQSAGVTRQTKEEADAHDKAAAALQRHKEAIQALADKYSGAALARQVKDLSEAMRKLPASSNFALLAEDIGKLFREGAKLTPEMVQLGIAFDTLLPKVVQGAGNITALGESFHGALMPAKDFTSLLPDVEVGIGKILNDLPKLDLKYQFEIAKPHIADVNKAIGDLSQALAQLAQVSGGTFGSMVADLAVVVEALNTVNKSLDSFSEGKKAFSEGDTLAGIAGMASGILGIASAAITAGKALANLFDRNKGRDLVTAFAGEHGGFDTLHEELLKLGADGEKLWINLTQGVGRNNPEQAKKAIQAIEEALGRALKPLTLSEQASAAGFKTIAELQAAAAEAQKLFEFMRDSGQYSAEAVQAAWERANEALIASGDQTAIAAKKAHDAIAALDDQIKSLTDSIANEAPEEVMGVIEQQTRAQIAALEEQRAAAQAAFEETGASAVDMAEQASDAFKDKFTTAAEAVADIIADDLQHTLDAADFVARLRFEYELPEGLSVPAGAEPTLGFAGGTHGQYLDFGAGRPVTLHGRERIMTEAEGRTGGGSPIIIQTYLDGRMVAESTVPHIPDVVRRYGLA